MPKFSADNLIASAALAATDGSQFNESTVREALDWGLRAARLGRGLPLPVLLDSRAVFLKPWPAPEVLRGDDSHRPPTAAKYDDWLRSFRREVRRLLRALGTDSRKEQIHWEPIDALPLLLAAWPHQITTDVDLVDWSEAYSALVDESSAIRHIHEVWQSRRELSHGYRDSIFPGTPEYRPLEDADRKVCWMWSRFALQNYDVGLMPETFDHAAAQFYLEADDPPIVPDQLARLRNLLRRSRHYISQPFTIGYEEQDPNYGAVALVTLTWEEYGEFKIVNDTHLRITKPPATPIPQQVNIHLCWANGHAGLMQLPDTQTGIEPHGRQTTPPSEASILQGVVALLLEDLRYALRKLPVKFYIHRGAESDALGRGGTRWKTQLHRGEGLPPSRMIDRLFARRLWGSIDGDLRRSEARRQNDLWCLCLLASDLAEFGIHQRDQTGQSARLAETVWTAPVDTLPDCFTHVILLQPSNQGSCICEVVRHRMARHFELRPLRERRNLPDLPGVPFLTLRICALDMILERLTDELR